MIVYRTETPPAASLDETRAYGRIEHGEDDNELSGLISHATDEYCTRANAALIDETITVIHDDWCDDSTALRLAIVPLRKASLPSVVVMLGANDITDKVTITHGHRPSIKLRAGHGLTTGERLNAVEITYTAGHGASTLDVPLSLRTAIAAQAVHVLDGLDTREERTQSLAPAFARALKQSTRVGIS